MIHKGREGTGSVGVSRSAVSAGRGVSLGPLPFRDLPLLGQPRGPHVWLSDSEGQGRPFLHSRSGHAPSHPGDHKTNCSGLETVG